MLMELEYDSKYKHRAVEAPSSQPQQRPGGGAAPTFDPWAAFDPSVAAPPTKATAPKLVRSDVDINEAVKLWCSDEGGATIKYGHISDWNVSSVTNMKGIFQNAAAFTGDVSKWNVSAVTNMTWMFDGAAVPVRFKPVFKC